MNICLICENEHKEHNIISYADMIPNENDIKEYMQKLSGNSNKLFIKQESNNIANDILITPENFEVSSYYQKIILKNF